MKNRSLLISLFVLQGARVGWASSWHPWYHDVVFDKKVEQTLENLRLILNETRSIQKATDQDHTYEDKYSLVEFVTMNTWHSLADAFHAIGLLNFTDLHQKNANASDLFLHSKAKTDCDMIAEEEVEVRDNKVKYEVNGKYSETFTRSHFVTQYTWKVTESYEIYLCFGSCKNKNNVEGKQDLARSRTMSSTVVTTSKSKPTQCPKIFTLDPINISWLLKRFSPGGFKFKINRNVESCKTPRRNDDVEAVLKHHDSLIDWLTHMEKYFHSIYIPPQYEGSTLKNEILQREVDWLSVVPLFENSTVLTPDRLELLHKNEQNSLKSMLENAVELFPDSASGAMVSSVEASLLIVLKHMKLVLWMHRQSTELVEKMLREQLVQAIGKEIGPQDFLQYMNFHSKNFFTHEFSPQPFSVAVRHGNSTPVGSFSVEQQTNDGYEPIQVLSRRTSGLGKAPFIIPLNAATNVEITGDRFLYGWMRYEFESPSSTQRMITARLVANARQFSSFILLVGVVTGPSTFDAKAGIILTNKDEVLVPILTETLPSAQEFKDAISSLSPEQQSFARAFRAMQLESSVFGICVIQIKPQLEKLLNLPVGSLAKEIKLTEDLMTLFLEYHIPADLMSFDGGDPSWNTTQKVKIVKQHVAAVNSVIDSIKVENLHEEKLKAKARTFASGQPTVSHGEGPSHSPSSNPYSSQGGGSRSPNAHSSTATTDSSGGKHGSQKNETYSGEHREEHDEDFTKIPFKLDMLIGKLDTDGYLRSMTIKTSQAWTLKRKVNLLLEAVSTTIGQYSEKRRAFDLLDAITRSGNLPIKCSEIHVVIGVSHNFVDSVMRTLYVDNINPINKAEKSLLLLGSEIFKRKPTDLVRNVSDVEHPWFSDLDLA
ncbi:hypothetical protein ACA910_008291 [Epithemia clementina (nom. ined.)]